MKSKIVLPVSLFGAVLGLSGLANAWRVAPRLWPLPPWPGEVLSAIAVTVWLACMLLYAAKWAWQRPLALAELRDPVQSSFLILVPVSTMLVAVLLLPYGAASARLLYLAGAAGAVLFGVWQQGTVLQGGRSLGSATPVLYMPSVAGNFIGAIGAGAFAMPALAQVFFGAGLLSWLAVESVLLHRMLHADAMPPPMRATFGVQLAPPAVGLLALYAATGVPPQLFALMLFGYALVQVLVAIRLSRWLLAGGFGLSVWSFAFGVTALSTGAQKLALGGVDLAAGLAPWLFLLANGVVGAVAVRSVWLLANGVLVPMPAAGIHARSAVVTPACPKTKESACNPSAAATPAS